MANLFWDSCIFFAYFSNNTAAYDVPSIRQHLEDARRGASSIYTSAIVLAEVVPSAFTGGDHADFQQFLTDFTSSIHIVNADPNVMARAAALKDLPYQRTGATGRQLGTGDAIMLASCLHLTEAYGVRIDAFHTYDMGKKRGLDGGKGIPLIGYESWCDRFTSVQRGVAQGVINLNRVKPTHAAPGLMLNEPRTPNGAEAPDGQAAERDEDADPPGEAPVPMGRPPLHPRRNINMRRPPAENP